MLHWTYGLSVMAQVSMLAVCILTLIFANHITPLLRSVLHVEVFVQITELLFYVYVWLRALRYTHTHILQLRYVDWVVTTPMMLISAMAVFRYTEGAADLSLVSLVKANMWLVLQMLLSNAVMLVVGFLYTLGQLSFVTSQLIGFAALFFTFYRLRQLSNRAWQVWPMLLLWAGYGLAVFSKPPRRNKIYNVLDVISKNVFGVYASYLSLSNNL